MSYVFDSRNSLMEHLDSLDEGIDSVRNVIETSEAFDSSVVTDVSTYKSVEDIIGMMFHCHSCSLLTLILLQPLWTATHRSLKDNNIS